MIVSSYRRRQCNIKTTSGPPPPPPRRPSQRPPPRPPPITIIDIHQLYHYHQRYSHHHHDSFVILLFFISTYKIADSIQHSYSTQAIIQQVNNTALATTFVFKSTEYLFFYHRNTLMILFVQMCLVIEFHEIKYAHLITTTIITPPPPPPS